MKTASPSHPVPIPVPTIPPLENGDRLTRDEFERRYNAMPDVNKAELVEGVVHMPSPVRFGQHGSPHAGLIGWLGVYWAYTPGVEVGDNSSLRLDPKNMPQPDAMMIILPSHGGRARVDADDYVSGAPEFLAEVAASSVSIDLHDKLEAYRRNQVQEYLVWRVRDQAIDWFVMRNGAYDRVTPDSTGVLRSETFPGLWLDAPALVQFDLLRVHQTLQKGLASPEHAAFVAKLQTTAAK